MVFTGHKKNSVENTTIIIINLFQVINIHTQIFHKI